MLESEELREKIASITNLPTLPQVASRLMTVINDPGTSSQDVSFIVGQDMSLAAKVLRLANSAFYGMPRTITNLNNAVVILGFRVLNTMVLSLTVFDLFPQDRTRVLFDREAFWRHGLGCGIIAKLLAQKMRKFVLFDPEEAFCAGLLHDIGKVAMEQYLHDDFRRALAWARDKKISSFAAEQQVLGYTHTEVASWLTSSWDLPAELHAPLLYHHEPALAGPCADVAALCHWADVLSQQWDLATDSNIPPPSLDQGVVGGLGITPADLENIRGTVPEELQKMDVFLEVAMGK